MTLVNETKAKTPIFYGVWLIIASLLGIGAAFILTLEKLHSLTAPAEKASCDFSVVVQCSANLTSAQGSAFGFPNPLIGLMVWPLVLVTAFLVLANVKLPKVYWVLFFGGILAGVSLVFWFINVSIFILGTLCLWCMVTWAAMVPTFLATLAHVGSLGVLGEDFIAFFTKAKSYVVAASIVIIAGVALMAQLQLDWIATIR